MRNLVIPLSFFEKRVLIYNGIWFLSRDVSHNMIGYKLGEFSFSKRSDTQLHLKFKSKKKK